MSMYFGLSAACAAFAAEFRITIHARSYYPIGWCFQGETVANAFPSPADDTILYFWDPDSGYIVNGYIEGWGWDDPDFVIENGVGFYYFNPLYDDAEITVIGTQLTAPSVTFYFEAGKLYFLGTAYLVDSSFVQCVQNCEGTAYPYTTLTLGYTPALGDIFYTWNAATQSMVGGVYYDPVPEACAPGGSTQYWRKLDPPAEGNKWAWGTYLSPLIVTGHGFWFKPDTNTTWTQYPAPDSCGE